MGTASSRISSHARTQWWAGAAASSAASSVVLPAPGSPDTVTRLRSCISRWRNAAACVREGVAGHQVGQRDVAHDVAPQRGRELVADRRDGGGEARRSAEHPGLDHRVLGVELPIGDRQHALDHLTVLVLAGRHRETAQASGAVEVRDPRAFDEDLLDVASGEQLGERTEIGDRAQHTVGEVGRVGERQVGAEHRGALVLVDRGADLATNCVEVDVGSQTTAIDADVHLAPDHVVHVDRHRDHRRPRGSGAGSIAARCRPRTPAWKAPRPTAVAVPRRLFDGAVVGTPLDRRGSDRPGDLGADLLLAEPAAGRMVHDEVQRRGAVARRARRRSIRAPGPHRPGSRGRRRRPGRRRRSPPGRSPSAPRDPRPRTRELRRAAVTTSSTSCVLTCDAATALGWPATASSRPAPCSTTGTTQSASDAQTVRAHVDGGAEVGFETEAQAPGERGRGFVRVEEQDRPPPFRQRDRDPERDLGDPAAPGTRHRDDHTRRPVVTNVGNQRGRAGVAGDARRGGVQRVECGEELGDLGVGGDGDIDAERQQVVLARGLVGIEHAEDAAAASCSAPTNP